MKRDISCDECAEKWRAAVGKYPGEHIKIVKGTALSDFSCDGCNAHLEKGSIVHAVSLYTARTPYLPWEDECINVVAKDD